MKGTEGTGRKEEIERTEADRGRKEGREENGERGRRRRVKKEVGKGGGEGRNEGGGRQGVTTLQQFKDMFTTEYQT